VSPPKFFLGRDLEEPSVSFDHIDRSMGSKGILGGLLNFGAYDKPSIPIRLALVTTEDAQVMMRKLIDRLNSGSMRYPGASQTFGCNIELSGEPIVCRSIEDYPAQLNEFVRTEQRNNSDLAFVYMPKDNEVNDPSHPYYRIKGLLLKEGLASQMVDRATILNPEWRDLNLALNVYAKAGNIPWVLDEAMTGVDMFIGLSYSQFRHGDKVVRMMSYVNVFDEHGRWRFYQSDTEAFAFEHRLSHYREIVKNSVAQYRANSSTELHVVQIHFTKKFSREERNVIANAVREVAPGTVVVFVSINPHHPVRLYDLSRTDGQIARATYLRNDPGRIYLVTTGDNEFNQKQMGTPIPLELTVWTDPVQDAPPTEQVAQHVLSLTRLNWASSRSFCHEPITTKFAGDIAKQMTAFMQDRDFFVNPILRGKPWFL
jgi:argonaute-like protein implicated in RNA metabolism and viral defense